MGESGDVQVFHDLPEALVDELLSKCSSASESLFQSFKHVHDQKAEIRKSLEDSGLLHRDSEISSFPFHHSLTQFPNR